MNVLMKICVAFLCLSVPQASAIAQALSPEGVPVAASGQVKQNLNGGFETICDVVYYGTTDSAGITFTSMTSAHVSGPLGCDADFEGIELPLRIEAASTTAVTFKNLGISTRLGYCGPEDVVAAWDNSSSKATLSASIWGWFGYCNVSAALSIAPIVQIN